MDRTDRDVAFDLGLCIRDARLRHHMTQREVAEIAGVSSSTVSRMELGHGLATPLGAWVSVARAVDLDPFGVAVDRTKVYLDAVTRLAAIGGWVAAGHAAHSVWLDRPPRPIRSLRLRQLPAERVVVRVLVTLTDLQTERERLQEEVRSVRTATLPGQLVEGLLVVVRSTATSRRLARTSERRSASGWISALRDPARPMPTRQGVVWLAPRGTHLLPGG